MKIKKLRKKLKKLEKKHGNLEVFVRSSDMSGWNIYHARDAYDYAPVTSIYGNEPAKVVIVP